MAILENALEGLAEGGVATGLAVGVGVLLLAPGILPAVGRALRPVAVGAIKTGMQVYEQVASTVRETAEDLVAEARAELDAEHGGAEAEPRRRRTRLAEPAT
ncbi:MAG: hypothetical protein JWL84_3180 [Rhodospirillales bacterium]|jgi:Sec-independent protein translocase protein TatA|nr:hypothetical protein [Rhodospirillales bacterium]